MRLAGQPQAAAHADEEGGGALRRLKPGEVEAAEQRSHDGAGQIDRQQRHLHAQQPAVRNGGVALRQSVLAGDQPGGQQHRQIGRQGRQPALAQPMFQAGGGFHGGGDGQKHQGEGQHVVGGHQQAGGCAQARQGDDGGHGQQVLAPRYGQAEKGEDNSRAAAVQVEMAWKRSVASHNRGQRTSTAVRL